MKPSRWPFCFLLVLTLATQSPSCFGQTIPDGELVDRIADSADNVLVMNNLDVVHDDVKRLLTDLGFEVLVSSVDEILFVDDKTGLNPKGGVIEYIGYPSDNVWNDYVRQTLIGDRDRLVEYLKDGRNRQIDEASSFPIDANWAPLQIFNSLIGGREVTRGMIGGNRLLTWGGDDEWAREILAAPPLARKLDPTSREIINTAGISLIGQFEPDDLNASMNLTGLVEDYSGLVTDAERDWLRNFTEVLNSAKLGLVGMKYHDKVLQLRSRAQLGNEKSLEGLIDFSKAEAGWKPELGFELEQLVVAAAFRMEAFRSSAAARVVPQVLLMESGRGGQLEFLQGDMLRILAELSGDSWNELTAARIGLYQNDAAENAGQLAIVGIVDSRNPDDVLVELGRLSRLTSPEALSVKAAERDDELLRLVEELASDNYNLSSRAETRLVLAGQAAVPALKNGIEARNQKLSERAERVLKRITGQANSGKKDVLDPGFWTTLNPGLRLEESTGTIAEFPVHTIHITPDPSKTREEVESASGLMQALFGDNWSTVRMVRIRNHFVFMVGSDLAMLERIAKNVDTGRSVLTKPYGDAGLAPVHGELQACVNSVRALDLLGLSSLVRDENGVGVHDEVCWIGLDFEPQAASAELLAPAKQIVPFFSIGLGL